MQFRRAVEGDIPALMALIRDAQAFLKAQGVDQWQNGYPNEDVLLEDIQQEQSYLLEERGTVLATTVCSFCQEKSYEQQLGGRWKYEVPYAVLHRTAVAADHKGKGLFSQLFCAVRALGQGRGVFSIRVDTHPDNLPMQRALAKEGFTYCGPIQLENGDPRIAFEWYDENRLF